MKLQNCIKNQAIKRTVNKKKLLEILNEESIYPNKRLGQHFLIDEQIAEKIASQIENFQGENILEIGAGLGSLTSHLLKKGTRITVIEIDAGLCRYLQKRFGTHIELHHADFLKINLPDHFSLCISNLPYYCASEILVKLAENYSMPVVYALVQKEMAQRLVAQCGSKQYGALTLTLSLHFHIHHLFDVMPSAFYPKPEVISSFLKFDRKNNLPNSEIIEIFHAMVKAAFWGRRKPIVNALARSPHCSMNKEQAYMLCAEADVNPTVRGEELNLEAFLRLANAYKRIFS